MAKSERILDRIDAMSSQSLSGKVAIVVEDRVSRRSGYPSVILFTLLSISLYPIRRNVAG